MRIMRNLLGLFLTSLAMTVAAQVPSLQKVGSSTCLLVNGTPFVMYCGELHNSTASSLKSRSLISFS